MAALTEKPGEDFVEYDADSEDEVFLEVIFQACSVFRIKRCDLLPFTLPLALHPSLGPSTAVPVPLLFH